MHMITSASYDGRRGFTTTLPFREVGAGYRLGRLASSACVTDPILRALKFSLLTSVSLQDQVHKRVTSLDMPLTNTA